MNLPSGKEGMDGRGRLKKSPDNGASWARRDLQVFSFSFIINMLFTYNYTGDGRGVNNLIFDDTNSGKLKYSHGNIPMYESDSWE